MTETLKDMMTARADAAPGPHLDIERVIGNGRRRVWRNRAMGGTGVCAALGAVALVVPNLSFGENDPAGLAGSGGFETRKATYSEGSTIHYGDQTIDVPHEVKSFVQTDDGFVFADANDTVYFTNGEDTAEISHAGAFTRFVADDSGSYVGWVEIDDGELSETVVYDTRAGAEVLRTDDDNGPGPGYLSDYEDIPSIDGLDGETVYVRNAEGVVAIDISTGESTVIIPPESDYLLSDVAGGVIARSYFASGMVVSADPDADEPRFPDLVGGDLSPNATHLAAGSLTTDDLRIVEVDGQDVTPALPIQGHVRGLFWVDDNSFIAYGGGDGPNGVTRSTTCSIASGTCTQLQLVAEGEIRLASGYDPYGS